MKDDVVLTLRDMAVTAKELMEPWEYFMSNCGENIKFIQRGTLSTETEMVRLMLDRLAEKRFKRSLKGIPIVVMAVKGTTMLHGMAMPPWGMLTFFFFTDIQMGIAAAMLPGSPEVTLARMNSFESKSKSAIMTSMFGGGVEN